MLRVFFIKDLYFIIFLVAFYYTAEFISEPGPQHSKVNLILDKKLKFITLNFLKSAKFKKLDAFFQGTNSILSSESKN